MGWPVHLAAVKTSGWVDWHCFHRLIAHDDVGEISLDIYWNPLRWRLLQVEFFRPGTSMLDWRLAIGPMWMSYIRLGDPSRRSTASGTSRPLPSERKWCGLAHRGSWSIYEGFQHPFIHCNACGAYAGELSDHKDTGIDYSQASVSLRMAAERLAAGA